MVELIIFASWGLRALLELVGASPPTKLQSGDFSAINLLKQPLFGFPDACAVMYSHRSPEDRFDIVDLDPYGSPHTFLGT